MTCMGTCGNAFLSSRTGFSGWGDGRMILLRRYCAKTTPVRKPNTPSNTAERFLIAILSPDNSSPDEPAFRFNRAFRSQNARKIAPDCMCGIKPIQATPELYPLGKTGWTILKTQPYTGSKRILSRMGCPATAQRETAHDATPPAITVAIASMALGTLTRPINWSTFPVGARWWNSGFMDFSTDLIF